MYVCVCVCSLYYTRASVSAYYIIVFVCFCLCVCVHVFSSQKFDVRPGSRQKVEVTFFVPLAEPQAIYAIAAVVVVVVSATEPPPSPLGPIKTRSDQPVRTYYYLYIYSQNSKLVFIP